MRRLLVVLIVVMGCTSWGADAKSAPKAKVAAAKKSLGAPTYLGPIARQLLKQRMARHGRDMMALVQSVLFLDRDTVQRLAGEIATEPRLTRPIAGGEDDLNASLPDRFFVLQDELRSRAQALLEVSKKGDDAAMASRLGELTQTCVACHSAYLEPAPPPSAP